MKKNLIFVIAIFVLFVLIYWASKFFKLNYNMQYAEFDVLNVVDWDTIKIKYRWDLTSVRLIGIDAPEKTKTRYW